jgi:hypothetical protein
MTEVIDRRGMLGLLLGGAAAGTVGLTLLPETAESAPFTMSAVPAALPENPIEEAAWVRRRVCWWHRGRRMCRWRRVRRRCWWRHGRRVCAYR